MASRLSSDYHLSAANHSRARNGSGLIRPGL